MSHFKDSGSGVRIISANGEVETLEGHIDEEEKKEKGEDLRNSIGIPVYKYKEPIKKKNGDKPHKRESVTKLYSRMEINAMQWEQVMQSAAKKNNLTGVIIGALLSGKKFKVNDMVKEVQRIWPEAEEKQIRFRFLAFYNKSLFAKFMETKQIEGSLEKVHKLKSVGMDLTPEELAVVYYGRKNKEDLEILFEVHPHLKPLLKEESAPTKSKAIPSAETSRPIPKEVVKEVITSKVNESMDINVNVSGRVEVVFKLKLS